MATDLEALLAAVVANPADDVARLVYADCLEENGNAPRARFIRLQIEAELYHPNSRAHADRTAEAAALFAAHWPDWWAEVCAATGLRPAARAPKSALGRLARWAGVGPRPGAPYEHREHEPFTVYSDWSQPNAQFGSAQFARGFPERLFRRLDSPTVFDQTLPARWARAVPLVALRSDPESLGPPGPHLAGLRELVLDSPFALELPAWLASPHLGQLEALSINSGNNAPEWAEYLPLPVMGRLKRLSTVLDSRALGEALAAAETLTAVHELAFKVEGPGGQGLAALHGSPLAARVERLELTGGYGGLQPVDVAALSSGWPHLRALHLDLGWSPEGNDADAVRNWAAIRALANLQLPALEDLRLSAISLADSTIDELVHSPHTKQLKHFALEVSEVNVASNAALRRLPEAFDVGRIETIFVRTNVARPELAELTRAFGDRVRLVTA